MHDVLVIGAGVMGCAAAYSLGKRGARPLVLERAVPGAEASSVAAGILGPSLEAEEDGPALCISRRALALHAALAEELRERTGIDVGYRQSGALMLAKSEAELAALEAKRAFLARAGLSAELVGGDAARDLEPGLTPELVGALALPEEAQLEPPRFLRALAIAAEQVGARFRTGATVRRVVVEDGRVVGADLGGEVLEAARVIVAAGSWTSLLPGLELGEDVIFPVRGQIAHCETRAPLLRRIVFGAGGYVVPRPDGRALVGATAERVGFRREVTLGGLERIAGIARGIAPGLAEAPFVEARVSFRPATPDGLPLVGRTSVEGLFVTSGHYRSGILLAPLSGELIADLVEGRAGGEASASFDPARFRPAPLGRSPSLG
jgi:glycine oxidase